MFAFRLYRLYRAGELQHGTEKLAAPTPYNRTFSFTDFQGSNPSSPLPGNQVDNELENVEQSLDQAIGAINDVRRSDGKLVNGIVTVDSLSPQVAAGVGTGALASAAAAAASAGAAADSAEASAASAGSAAGYAGTAATSAGTAMAARNDALNAVDDATAMAVSAASYRDFAAAWSSAPEGQDVDDGVNPVNKSAYHWAMVAEGAASGALPDGSVTTTKIADEAVTLAKVATEVLASANHAYDNTASGLEAENAQGALDELAQRTVFASTLAPLMQNYFSGCIISPNAVTPNTKLDIAPGVVNSQANTRLMSVSAGTIDLTIVGANGRDAGTLAANTWYHIFAIGRVDGATAFLASTSVIAPTLPSEYTWFRRLGARKTNASSQLVPVFQIGNRNILGTPTNAYPVTTNPGTSAILVATDTPDGAVTEAIVSVWLEATQDVPGRKVAAVTSLVQPDYAVAAGTTSSISAGAPLGTGSSQVEFRVMTNTSRQIRLKLANSDAGTRISVNTVGWIDHV